VKATPGTLQEGGAGFVTTHWSIVARSALTDVPEAENALAKLCEMYWPPVYSFIRRRGGGYRFVPLNPETAEASYNAPSARDLTAERLFESRWANALAAGALNSLREELQAEGKVKLFEKLKSFLTGGSVLPSYDDASVQTGLPRATVKTHVHRLRQRYREIVRREIARTVSAPHEIDDELRCLCDILARGA